ncbi:hypothetical protein B0H14DRAFT_2905391 [Mycena olivaceomarginata]|nr:hypothetical protein B0H14DRAFT_2905391 [Mycena olivaceomarginata]
MTSTSSSAVRFWIHFLIPFLAGADSVVGRFGLGRHGDGRGEREESIFRSSYTHALCYCESEDAPKEPVLV